MNPSQIKPFKETGIHSYHRRSFHHDYYAPFIYHIILKKNPTAKAFGAVTGNAGIPFGHPGCATIKESELGSIIAKSIIHLPYQFPIIRLHKYCVMPDHVHILLQILYHTDRHLDYYIDSIKERIARLYSQLRKSSRLPDDIFLPGYCDKPLYNNRSLDGLYRYIEENPHRLAVRLQFPNFFRRTRSLMIQGIEYEAYGNLFLLRNPDKAAVKISRKFSPEEKSKKRNSWLEGAARGTVLVSPFIHPEEKEIRSTAENLEAGIILITHEAFGERFKPAAHDFELCSNGRLLIISLGLPEKTDLSRPICERMNNLAKVIADLSYPSPKG